MKFYGKGDEQELIDDAITAAGMAWWLMELPSGAVFFHPAKATMLGYSEEEAAEFVHYTHFTDLVHPDDHDACMKAMQDHLEGKKDRYEVTYRIRTKDGNYRKYYDRGKITGRKDDGSLAVTGIVTDMDLFIAGAE